MTECEGCKARDEMIRILSARIDELEELRDEATELMAQALENYILELA